MPGAKGGGIISHIVVLACSDIIQKKRDKAHKTIMKATNNGKAWWLLQSINAERHFRKSED